MGTAQLLENTLSQEELNEIVQMYQDNVSLREISRRTGHGRQGLTRMLENLGIKTTKGNHHRYYFFDFNFFEKIDTPLKAYWLGFLYADGCILSKREYGEQDFQLTLAKQDEEILEKFKEDLKSTYPLRYDVSRYKKGEGQVQVICKMRSQKTVDDLKRLGCVERKSLVLQFPTKEQVPNKFIWDFIRGYFDGDGSISEYNGNYIINFVGTKDFITSLFEIVGIGSVFPDKRKENSWYLNINGNRQIIKMYHQMYDNADRYLLRKYNKFQSLLEKYDESQGI